MKKTDRKIYEAPKVQELGELRKITQNGSSVNSDTAPFPADNNPNDAYGPFAS